MLVNLLAQLGTSGEDQWANWFFGLDQAQRFVALLTIVGCITGVIITLATFVYSSLDAAHRRRTEADLKREMLDRGMSPDDVVKIIEAASPPEDAASRWVAS